MRRAPTAEDAEKAKPERFLRITKASSIPMKGRRWMWRDERGKWIPQADLTLMAGREGVGKSTIVYELVAKVTKGILPGSYFGKPKSVIVCATEDAWAETIVPRLAAAGADLDRVYQIDAITPEGFEGTLSLPEDTKRLEEKIREFDVSLVLLDPLLSTVNAKLDSHKDAEVRMALDPLVRLAHETRIAMIGLIHVNKSQEGDLMNRLMASRAFGAIVRVVLFAAKYDPLGEEDEEGEDTLADIDPARFVFGQIKNNLAEKVQTTLKYHMVSVILGYDQEAEEDIEAPELHWDDEILENVEDVVVAQEKAKKGKGGQTVNGAVAAWLVKHLAGRGEVPSHEVIDQGVGEGYSERSIYRAKTALGVRIKVKNLPTIPRTTTWRLLVSSDTTDTTDSSGSTGSTGNLDLLNEQSIDKGSSTATAAKLSLSPELAVLETSNGQSPKPGDAPCSICGVRLGWSMVRRGLDRHVPECPKEAKTDA